MTIFKIGIASTSEVYKVYTLKVDTEKKRVECNCKAGRILGRCKHMRFYKDLIKELMK
ncbi:unnamed protein product [marine sediment metagenome]|uniref:SWIM-type domain-containing protein n=1 Tax=marine sediment metagenome TaxID=412755 RepID=X1JRD1_9ZZZZ